jgi:hypothetical protein
MNNLKDNALRVHDNGETSLKKAANSKKALKVKVTKAHGVKERFELEDNLKPQEIKEVSKPADEIKTKEIEKESNSIEESKPQEVKEESKAVEESKPQQTKQVSNQANLMIPLVAKKAEPDKTTETQKENKPAENFMPELVAKKASADNTDSKKESKPAENFMPGLFEEKVQTEEESKPKETPKEPKVDFRSEFKKMVAEKRRSADHILNLKSYTPNNQTELEMLFSTYTLKRNDSAGEAPIISIDQNLWNVNDETSLTSDVVSLNNEMSDTVISADMSAKNANKSNIFSSIISVLNMEVGESFEYARKKKVSFSWKR